jgi:GcrA cell cycle regulator
MKTKTMAWNDERIDLLKKLWVEGLSASTIAGRLGDVTRNAVIGKVHRLGLSGRRTTSRECKPRQRPATPKSWKRSQIAIDCASEEELAGVESLLAQLARAKPRVQPASTSKPLLQIVRKADELLDAGVGVRLIDLKENMCRWPKGDPKTPDFHFCGRQAGEGQPYCACHGRLAFKPARAR